MTRFALLGVCAEEDDDASAAEGHCITTQASSRTTSPSAAQTNGNGHSPTPTPPAKAEVERPTDQHITALFTLVEECEEPSEVFEVRLRTIMGLKPSASVARRLLPRTMTMDEYMRAVTYYQTLLAQLAQVKEGATRGTRATTDQPNASAGVSAPASVATTDECAKARDALRTEALSWGIETTEVDHILKHHPDLTKARGLLWRARRPAADTLVAAG